LKKKKEKRAGFVFAWDGGSKGARFCGGGWFRGSLKAGKRVAVNKKGEVLVLVGLCRAGGKGREASPTGGKGSSRVFRSHVRSKGQEKNEVLCKFVLNHQGIHGKGKELLAPQTKEKQSAIPNKRRRYLCTANSRTTGSARGGITVTLVRALEKVSGFQTPLAVGQGEGIAQKIKTSQFKKLEQLERRHDRKHLGGKKRGGEKGTKRNLW